MNIAYLLNSISTSDYILDIICNKIIYITLSNILSTVNQAV